MCLLEPTRCSATQIGICAPNTGRGSICGPSTTKKKIYIYIYTYTKYCKTFNGLWGPPLWEHNAASNRLHPKGGAPSTNIYIYIYTYTKYSKIFNSVLSSFPLFVFLRLSSSLLIPSLCLAWDCTAGHRLKHVCCLFKHTHTHTHTHTQQPNPSYLYFIVLKTVT